ncbi:MAG: 4Fe-4S binding protein [Anaerolineae bacterium]|nr:4Fe-4S binding protein [Anaerolineae bacterium]
MSRFRSIIYLLPQLGRTLFTRQITVRYPFGPLELPAYFRGRVVVDAELCRGCGACTRDCPAMGLELQSEGRNRFRLVHYPDRCANCGQCEASCRFGAIRLVNEYVQATAERERLVEVLVERTGDDRTPPSDP